MRPLVGLSVKEIEGVVEEMGFEKYRGRQLAKWIYKKFADFEDMTDLPKVLRKKLSENFFLSSIKLIDEKVSADGTRKFLFELMDGERIESVLIPSEDRRTLCVSTQVGCPLGCKFCLTGKMGFRRNLSVFEVTSQVWEVKRRFSVTNIVFMGMGEPFLNYENVAKSVEIIVSRDGFDLSKRRVTVSTSGVVPGIYRMVDEELPAKLAVSLNSTFDHVRSEIMPINKKYPLKELLKALEYHRKKRGGMVTLEYVLIKDVNDSLEEARRLVDIARRVRGKVNLIPYNETPALPFKSPREEDVLRFQRVLFDGNVTALIRESRGGDILAACGQLAGGYI